MKKYLLFIFGLILIWPGKVLAAGEYTITNFDSRIEILQDTRIRVTETIQAKFLVAKHGIFRVIPNIYDQVGIDSQVTVERVTDEQGRGYQYTTSKIGNDLQIKIGSASFTLTGPQTYVLTYTASHMVRRFGDHDELYWNVVGSKWDTDISQVSAQVISPWAKVIKMDCFAGWVGTSLGGCDRGGAFEASDLGSGKDMTIVVGLDKNNQLLWPSWWQENWLKVMGYAVAILPAIIMGWIWYKGGRDFRYKNNPNIYVKPDGGEIEPVPIWAREYLPLAYTPIKDVSPAEAGTIIDQKIDVSDVVAEIVELARLGYIQIKKIKDDDYWFIKQDKDVSGLREYQKTLLSDITNVDLFSPGSKVQIDVAKTTSLKKMNAKFRLQMVDFKDKLYKYLDENKIFDGRPDKIRNTVGLMVGLTVVLGLTFGFGVMLVTAMGYIWTGLLIISWIITLFFAYFMPNRTAWGYSLYRQLVGLRYYINKGKWRYDIAEKRLFIEEILPLAIALGVVDKLANDMKGLGIEAPDYMGNMTLLNINAFSGSVRNSLASSVNSGSGWGNSGGHWSGGSGFGGGGSSGGGGGGGGGGSW